MDKERKIVEYLHLYIGAEIERWFDGQPIVSKLDPGNLAGFILGWDSRWHKLRLRPLSDMTEEEKIMFCCLNMPVGWQPGHLIETNDEDIAAMRIFDNAGEYKSLYISKNKITPNNFIWLLSKGFDLFNLIPSGLAIDSTTLKTQQ